MRPTFFVSLTVLATGLGTIAVEAATSKIAWLNPDAAACYSRTYSADHLEKHPKQKVSSIAFTYVPLRSFDGGAPEKQAYESGGITAFNGTVLVKMKGQEETFLTGLYCTAETKTAVRCVIDEDGGQFLLTQTKDILRLDNPDRFNVYSAAEDPDADAGKNISIMRADDHEVFLMPASKGGLCDVK